jgi:hypothetical protein
MTFERSQRPVRRRRSMSCKVPDQPRNRVGRRPFGGILNLVNMLDIAELAPLKRAGRCRCGGNRTIGEFI